MLAREKMRSYVWAVFDKNKKANEHAETEDKKYPENDVSYAWALHGLLPWN
jgi:hypothetical protein